MRVSQNLKAKRGDMEKQFIIDDMTLRDSWRLFHIMAEFVEGFEKLSEVQPAITVFGSARTKEGDDLYTKAYELALTLGRNNSTSSPEGGRASWRRSTRAPWRQA